MLRGRDQLRPPPRYVQVYYDTGIWPYNPVRALCVCAVCLGARIWAYKIGVHVYSGGGVIYGHCLYDMDSLEQGFYVQYSTHRIRIKKEGKANSRRCFPGRNGRPQLLLCLCSRRIDTGGPGKKNREGGYLYILLCFYYIKYSTILLYNTNIHEAPPSPSPKK